MLRRLYDWTMRLASGPNAKVALGTVSFAESSFFPIPPDVVLVPMVLAKPRDAWLLATICTVTSVVGGILGYIIGALLFDSLGQWVIRLYGYEDAMHTFRDSYAAWGAWIILLKGLTPIPYKIVTLTAGFAGYDFLAFVVLSAITRGMRFFFLAWLLRRFGEPIRDFIEKRLELVALGLFAAIVIGVVLTKFVF